MNIILDSNVFDDLVNGKLDLKIIVNRNVYITHIQIDELNKCPDEEKRAKLFNSLLEIKSEKIPTESNIIGTSRIGSAKIGDGNLIDKLIKDNYKNTNDALIGETAIKNKMTLITNDHKLKNRVIELGGNSLTVDQLING